MCINSRFIYNPYSKRSILVKCGNCECCQQEKAALRSNRIRNNMSFGTIALFVTLTYTNDYVPYIKRSDLASDSFDVNVYRNADFRYTFSRYQGLNAKKVDGISIVDNVFIPLEYRSSSTLHGLVPLQKSSSDNIGVCLYSDFQKFIKRLRVNLERKYHVTGRFSYFVCSEYGAKTNRPHFHALLFIPSSFEKEFRQAILASWSYADSRRTSRYIEIARDAASYVSSYVNGNSNIPECLQDRFAQKHHYSQHFGVGLDCFSLASLLEKIEQRALYYYTRKEFDGASCVNDVPIPAYVINRFFPKFKGYSWLSDYSLFNIARKPYEVCNELSKIDNPLYHYSPKESYAIYVRLSNAQNYFCDCTGLSPFDFGHYYVLVWNLLSSQHLKDSYKDIEQLSDFADFYDNANDLYNGLVSAPTLPDSIYDDLVVNPNERSDVVLRNIVMLDLYTRMNKQKKVTNIIMSYNGHNV